MHRLSGLLLLRSNRSSGSFRCTPESPVLAGEPQERNRVAIVQRGCRLEIVADLDLEGLDKLGETLNGYQKILQLWAPEKP